MKSKVITSKARICSDGRGPNGRKKIEKAVEDRKPDFKGNGIETYICSTCCHKETCLFLRASRLPIYQCEEFSDSTG